LASGAPPRATGNRINVISSGTEAFARLIALIDSAERELHVSTFILGGFLGRDEAASHIVERLEAKARSGVTVRFLLDGLGMAFANRAAIRGLRASGARVASFLPLLHLPFHGHSNLRNHRKIVVADGARGMLGGMNLAREYLGPEPDPERWEDLACTVEGPMAASLDAVFAADWEFATGERIAPAAGTDALARTAGADAARANTAGTSSGQIVPNGPDVANDLVYDGLLTAIFEARERIWIVTPYFVPDETLTRALELACRRGVDVRILVPRRSNHLLPDLGRGSYLRQLEEEGARILLHPKMVHAKVTLIDRRCAVVGSANTDMRSFFYNFEICAFLYSDPEIDRIADWFEGLETRCQVGYPRPWRGQGMLEGICRILSPLL
jgi:cardiolipin synthase